MFFLSSSILNIGSQISIFEILFSKWDWISDFGATFTVYFETKKSKSEIGEIHQVESKVFSQPLSPASQSSSPHREQNFQQHFSPLWGGVSQSDEGVIKSPSFIKEGLGMDLNDLGKIFWSLIHRQTFSYSLNRLQRNSNYDQIINSRNYQEQPPTNLVII